MKKWTILLLTAALLLQTACSDTPRVSVAELTQREELQMEETLDLQESYPAERPLIEKEETPKEDDEKQEEKPPVEQKE